MRTQITISTNHQHAGSCSRTFYSNMCCQDSLSCSTGHPIAVFLDDKMQEPPCDLQHASIPLTFLTVTELWLEQRQMREKEKKNVLEYLLSTPLDLQ